MARLRRYRRFNSASQLSGETDELGETVVQTVLVVPVVLTFMWLALQATVFMHDAHMASAAASEGAAVASRYGSSEVAGRNAAVRLIAELGATAASSPTVIRQGRDVIATVSIRVPRIAPFFPSVVTRTAREVKEKYMTEEERNR
jgi:Flp pilus assembly protein TadG